MSNRDRDEDGQDDLEEAMVTEALRAKGIQSAENERIEHRSVEEIIAVDKHLTNKAAASGGFFGLRFGQLVPPGGGGTP